MYHHETHPHKTSRKPCGCKPEKRCNCECEPAPCCDDATPPYREDCCELHCFERPNFFQGQLLTADDLAAAQRYAIEKNKLHNRTLHGSGVVCGLRLACEPGSRVCIRIGEGYALDDCGHDIVVCAPDCFDVIAALRDQCRSEPGCPPRWKKPDACSDKEICYQVAICYREQQKCFASPAAPGGCDGGQRDQRATRINETHVIRLLAAEERPHRKTLAERWRELGEKGAKPLVSGALRRALNIYAATIRKIINQEPERDLAEYERTFAALKRSFLQDAEQHPRLLRCGLKEDLSAVRVADPTDVEYATRMKTALLELLSLIWNAIYSAELDDLVFECVEPWCADCVILGTVVVKNGAVISVCNCPRDYVITAANALQVAAYHLYAGNACVSTSAANNDLEQVCCRTWQVKEDNYEGIFFGLDDPQQPTPAPSPADPTAPSTTPPPPVTTPGAEAPATAPSAPATPSKPMQKPGVRRPRHPAPAADLADILEKTSDRFASSATPGVLDPITDLVAGLREVMAATSPAPAVGQLPNVGKEKSPGEKAAPVKAAAKKGPGK